MADRRPRKLTASRKADHLFEKGKEPAVTKIGLGHQCILFDIYELRDSPNPMCFQVLLAHIASPKSAARRETHRRRKVFSGCDSVTSRPEENWLVATSKDLFLPCPKPQVAKKQSLVTILSPDLCTGKAGKGQGGSPPVDLPSGSTAGACNHR